MEMSLEILEPTELQLNELKKRYSELTISGPDDKVGYAAVHTARKDLGYHRVQIGKRAKEIRDEATKFNRDIIALERKLISIIEPLEKRLYEKELRIDNVKLLPERIRELKALEYSPDEDLLLTMKATEYKSLLNKVEKEFHERKQREELEKQRAAQEAERIRLAEENARKKAELEAEKKIKAIEEQADQKIWEVKQMSLGEDDTADAHVKKATFAENVAQDAIDDKRFELFLLKNSYNHNTDFIKGNNLYRLVATFTPVSILGDSNG